LQDNLGRIHLVWYSDQVINNYADQQSMKLIYESILLETGWSEPAIIERPSQQTWPALTSLPDGKLFLAWGDTLNDSPALLYSRQDPYNCSSADLTDPAQAVLGVVEGGQFHPEGYKSPFCGNRYETFIYMPNPNPEFSNEVPSPNGGYDRLARLVQEAQYEVLISNMQWDEDQGDGLSPGYRIVEGIDVLYQQVKANPERYPRGMTVRILLGNYPNVATFTYGDQIWNVINDLHAAGVEMEDAEIGWKVEVANFSGSYPHAHTKFIIIDGGGLLSAGFNISFFHLPGNHPSEMGDDLTDLGLIMIGPVAQSALSAFDDEWNGANQLVCSDMGIGDNTDRWQKSCEWQTASVSHTPEILKYYLTEENQTAFALYRTDVYKEADDAYVAAIESSKSSIDAIHVNFSAQLICYLEVVAPGICTFEENALPWMKALVNAVEQNHTHVRVIVENSNANGLENRIGLKLLDDELARLGLSDYVEMRFFDGRVHAKSALIDDQLLFIGSQNFHYSSFGPSGLLEFGVATESPEAIQSYQDMFEYYWPRAIPSDEAVWGDTSE
jgi:phosphatidylserine/phosphatidylglycerophosphate/cardiolipin synthase-like enzyme